MTLAEDAAARLGPAAVQALEDDAGCHSHEPAPPIGTAARLAFAMLEAVDFDCPRFDWGCPHRRRGIQLSGVAADDLRRLLRDHRAAVLAVPMPSALGVLGGAFDFLATDDGK